MTRRKLTVDRPGGSEPTATEFEVIGESPVDSSFLRIEHATASIEIQSEPEAFFDAFTQFAEYDRWAPEMQGSAHWLTVEEEGPGSKFIAYDKPGTTHLAHYGEVIDVDRPHRFEWRAPFSEWQRVYLGTILECEETEQGTATVTETLYFDVREEHLPVLAGFTGSASLQEERIESFLETRLRGLDALLKENDIPDDERSFLFTEARTVAADWAGRISDGEWVRVLYADGEVDFDAPADEVFNAFSRFARYADWTRDIHVGCEWLDVKEGGVGSRFLIWENPVTAT